MQTLCEKTLTMERGTITLLKGERRQVEAQTHQIMIKGIIETGRPAFYVDCMNTFNPYRTAAMCREWSLEERSVLEKIRVSRPFTAYQLNTLLQEGLPRELETEEPSLLIYSGLLSLFTSEDVEEEDAHIMLKRLPRDIQRTSSTGYPLLITHPSPLRKGLGRLTRLAGRILTCKKDSLIVEKDPEKPPFVISQRTRYREPQLSLDTYLGVC